MSRSGLPRYRQLTGLAGLLAAFFVLASVYNAVSTPFEAPDEVGHFYYVLHLLRTGQLPVVPAPGPPPNYEHEGVQPPLYYAGGALWVRVLRIPLALDWSDAGEPLAVNPHSACAQVGARTNVAYFSHDPHAERFPYSGRVRVLHVLRLWSTLWAAAAVAGVYMVTRLAFLDQSLAAWLAAGLAAFTPEFLFTAGAVTNDVAVTALGTWGVLLALRLLRVRWRWWHALLMGGLAGLATLAKLSGAALLPLFLLLIAIKGAADAGSRPSRGVRVLACGAWTLAAFAAVCGWWFIRNWRLYGSLTGTSAMLAMLPLRDHVSVWQLVVELPGLFRSWWGAFGCTAPPVWYHLPYLLLSLAGLSGLAWACRSRRSWSVARLLLAAWFVLLLAAYVAWNWRIHAAKGRLLYPALVSVAAGLGIGLAHWVGRRRWLGAAVPGLLAAAALAVPVGVMGPAAAKPPIYASPAAVAPRQPLNGCFGSEIALLGYDLSRRSFAPGQALDLTLYWHALARPAQHLSVAIQLVSAVPGDVATLVNHNAWPARGLYPTGNWHAGDVIADRYTLRLPAQVERAQAWRVEVILFDPVSGRRVPFTRGGQPAGDSADLGLVRVGGSVVSAPPEAARLSAPPRFGDAVALEGIQPQTDERGTTKVNLWWRGLAPLTQDAVVFVHLYDASGRLLATGDGPPLAGGFPLSLWEAGDVVAEERVLVPVEPGASQVQPARIGVGWYDPVSGVRLPAASGDGSPLPDDEFLVLLRP